jgi:chaperonin GroEL (HSP60 family)
MSVTLGSKGTSSGLQSSILVAVRMNSRNGVVDVPAAARMLNTMAFDIELDEHECARLVTEAASLLGISPHTVGGRFAKHL